MRRLLAPLGLALLVLGLLAPPGLAAHRAGPAPRRPAPSRRATVTPYLRVRGNQLHDRAGAIVQLRGVNRDGAEYACEGGWGDFAYEDSGYDPNQPSPPQLVDLLASWGVNVVRLQLSEACWNDTNHVAAGYGGAAYQDAIRAEVAEYEDAGMYVILSVEALPGSFSAVTDADEGPVLRYMLDRGHGVRFWRSMAQAFGRNRGVVFDLFNEPHNLSWGCLEHGCLVTGDDSSDFGIVGQDDPNTAAYDPYPEMPDYQSAGTDRLVSVIRAAGAKNVIMVPGLDWTADLGRWLSHEPADPMHNVAASFHNYPWRSDGTGGGCYTQECWNDIFDLARTVPVITGEFGDDETNTYAESWMTQADEHGVSYVAWAFNHYGDTLLITDYDGTTTPFGTVVRDHLQALAGLG